MYPREFWMFEWINVKILIRGMTVAALGLALLCTAAQARSPAGRHHDVSSRAVARSSSESLRATADALPDDPFFEDQWGDLNTGQSVPSQDATTEELGGPVAGIAGDDDGAARAWSVSTGSPSIVIGETDTGVDYEHPDLAANIWTNPGGIGGCPAGTHGFDVLNDGCYPMDDDTVYGGHGTHVAGIMGAVGDNGIGVAGMDWHTSILPVKWLNSKASGETSGLIEALQWLVLAKQKGVNIRVVNDSATFIGTTYSPALSNEIDTLGANGILFVTAAGNSGENDEEEAARRYPCGYDRPTELCVTASDNNDQLPTWANYGPHTVDLAAPGASIYSTLREGSYGYLSGGSMAAPQVAGAAALILSVDPILTPQELKSRILASVTPVRALAGKLISGGILNVCKAMPGCEKTAQAPGEPAGTPSSTGPVQQPAPVEAVGSKPAAPIPLPTISAPLISPPRFSVLRRLAGAKGGRRAVGGARIEYRDSERARTIFAVLVPRPGVIGARGSCVRAPARALRQARKCVRWIEVGTFAHVDRAGRNRLPFSGRIGGHGLPPGRYRLQATPVLAGKAGQTRSASFTIASARSL
jgi:hypothetical protein